MDERQLNKINDNAAVTNTNKILNMLYILAKYLTETCI